MNDRVASLAVFNAASHGSKRLHFHNVRINRLDIFSLSCIPTSLFAPVQVHIHSLAPYTQHEVRALATSHAPAPPRLSRHSCAQSTIVIVTPQVHGVLGQRAISPAPMTQPPVEQPGGGEGQRTLAALDTTTFSAALGLGGGGVGTSTTVRAAVQVDGRLQGEGAIVGSYRDYQASTPRMYRLVVVLA